MTMIRTIALLTVTVGCLCTSSGCRTCNPFCETLTLARNANELRREMLYQEILENIAMLLCNEESLPTHNAMKAGTIQIGRKCVVPKLQKHDDAVTAGWSFETQIARGTVATLYERLIRDLNSGQSVWFFTGSCDMVPEDVAYVGNYHGTYVWVPPSLVSDLDQFATKVERAQYPSE